MKETGKRKESETTKLEIIKHNGRPEFASYVKAGGLRVMSAAELYFSVEPEGMLVFRICNRLAALTVEKVAEMLDNFGDEEVAMMLQEVRNEPPIMGVGYIQGMLVTTFNEDAAEMLEMLRICEYIDDRVYDCFMERFWACLRENEQLKFFFEGYEA